MESSTLKTVNQLSKKYKVSRQTIYNKVNEIRENMPSNEQDKYINYVDEVLHITPEGQQYIKELLGIKVELSIHAQNTDKTTDKEKDTNRENETLLASIKALEKQLEIKDLQINKLMEIIDKQNNIKMIEEGNILRNKLLESQNQEDTNKEKKSLWQSFKDLFK